MTEKEMSELLQDIEKDLQQAIDTGETSGLVKLLGHLKEIRGVQEVARIYDIPPVLLQDDNA